MNTITVTWMDGGQETYRADSWDTQDESLNIYEYTGVVRSLKNEWHVPLYSVRAWKVER